LLLPLSGVGKAEMNKPFFFKKIFSISFLRKIRRNDSCRKIKLLKIARAHDLIFQVVGANQVY